MTEELERERDRRLGLFDTIMEEKGLDALLFTSHAQQTCQIAVKYATNYSLITRRDFAFVEKGKIPYLLVPTEGQKYNAGQIGWIPDANIITGDILNNVVCLIKSMHMQHPKIGLYESSLIPVGIDNVLRKTAAEFIDITEMLTLLRAPKSEFELKLIKKTSDLAVDSFRHVVRNMTAGMTEWDIYGLAEGYLRAHGAEDTLLLCRSTKPHTFITKAINKVVTDEDVFVYSCEMAGPGGYWSQLVRPIFLGKGCQNEAYRVLQVIKEALRAAEKVLKPGNRICDVNAAIDEVVKKNGCKAGVWSGHGMGADLGDNIDIGSPNKMELKPNMILTLHPSVIGNGDGLLCGNTYKVTENGFENLTGAYMDTCYLDELKHLIK